MKKVLLIILDGWGLSPLTEGNATYLARTPNLDWIYGAYPKTSLSASGIDVGITPGESGNSEVGHLALGSGRVVWESLPRIDQSIASGKFFQLQPFLKAIQAAKLAGRALHLIGLCSSGRVHSSLDHLFALLKMAAEQKVEKVFIHLITDGRDTAPQVAREDIKLIEAKIREFGVGKIASVIGRFYAMDRDKHFERTEKAYKLWTAGAGDHYPSAEAAIDANYRAGVDDEKIAPSLIDPNGVIRPGDGVIFFNFRADRMRQIVQAFEAENFSEFSRRKIGNLALASMAKYYTDQLTPAAFLPLDMSNVLADVIEAAGCTQSHIAETEKYAHVTYFFNGGEEQPHQHEKQILVPSPRVESYADVPEMSAIPIREKVIEEIKAGSDFIVVNFANGDMVGHTGDLSATIKAVETIDDCLGKIFSAASAKGYTVIITADHGNCEVLINLASKEIDKEHNGGPVPFVVADLTEKPFTPLAANGFDREKLLEYSAARPTGILADVAPTILQIMGIPKPAEMSGIDISQLI